MVLWMFARNLHSNQPAQSSPSLESIEGHIKLPVLRIHGFGIIGDEWRSSVGGSDDCPMLSSGQFHSFCKLLTDSFPTGNNIPTLAADWLPKQPHLSCSLVTLSRVIELLYYSMGVAVAMVLAIFTSRDAQFSQFSFSFLTRQLWHRKSDD
jgi:hypothetical protein